MAAVDFTQSDAPYMTAVLRYCAEGNLQAMLDENVFVLATTSIGQQGLGFHCYCRKTLLLMILWSELFCFMH